MIASARTLAETNLVWRTRLELEHTEQFYAKLHVRIVFQPRRAPSNIVKVKGA